MSPSAAAVATPEQVLQEVGSGPSLLRFVHGRSEEVVHAAWFLFLGSTALFILFAVRQRKWFFNRPWPSTPVLAALGAAFVVTVALVNVPEAHALLRFGALSLPEQLGIEAYSLAYLLVADVTKQLFRRTQLHADWHV